MTCASLCGLQLLTRRDKSWADLPVANLYAAWLTGQGEFPNVANKSVACGVTAIEKTPLGICQIRKKTVFWDVKFLLTKFFCTKRDSSHTTVSPGQDPKLFRAMLVLGTDNRSWDLER